MMVMGGIQASAPASSYYPSWRFDFTFMHHTRSRCRHANTQQPVSSLECPVKFSTECFQLFLILPRCGKCLTATLSRLFRFTPQETAGPVSFENMQTAVVLSENGCVEEVVSVDQMVALCVAE
ncbi:hypothetical protein E2C01_042531 [Portunus trituberculatus]|uniref:Uncharacterized protein n=1 Tax=Portunus trituberculatus TaxID=210409 RepID=A0A5B7FV22_PORTR|nr:hypothetical protein [Portunus trituberculatus]